MNSNCSFASKSNFNVDKGFYHYELFQKLQKIESFDGGPLIETQSNGRVKYLDLTLPIYHLPFYDWILCLEVIEHIPPDYEDIVIENLVRHAKYGVVLSWDRERKEGYNHVNGREQKYIDEKMGAHCFYNNRTMSNFLKNSTTSLVWLKLNINVFIRNLTCKWP